MDITDLSKSGSISESDDVENIYPLVYQELRRIAHNQLGNAWNIPTLCTTALVNEAYVKLNKHRNIAPRDKAHFLAIAARAMRQIIVNYAKSKQALKRGGDWLQITYEETLLANQHSINTLLALNDSLEEIKALDEDLSSLIEMRFFAGMTESEIANVFNVNERTIRRNWKKAKALLSHSLCPK